MPRIRGSKQYECPICGHKWIGRRRTKCPECKAKKNRIIVTVVWVSPTPEQVQAGHPQYDVFIGDSSKIKSRGVDSYPNGPSQHKPSAVVTKDGHSSSINKIDIELLGDGEKWIKKGRNKFKVNRLPRGVWNGVDFHRDFTIIPSLIPGPICDYYHVVNGERVLIEGTVTIKLGDYKPLRTNYIDFPDWKYDGPTGRIDVERRVYQMSRHIFSEDSLPGRRIEVINDEYIPRQKVNQFIGEPSRCIEHYNRINAAQYVEYYYPSIKVKNIGIPRGGVSIPWSGSSKNIVDSVNKTSSSKKNNGIIAPHLFYDCPLEWLESRIPYEFDINQRDWTKNKVKTKKISIEVNGEVLNLRTPIPRKTKYNDYGSNAVGADPYFNRSNQGKATKKRDVYTPPNDVTYIGDVLGLPQRVHINPNTVSLRTEGVVRGALPGYFVSGISWRPWVNTSEIVKPKPLNWHDRKATFKDSFKKPSDGGIILYPGYFGNYRYGYRQLGL